MSAEAWVSSLVAKAPSLYLGDRWFESILTHNNNAQADTSGVPGSSPGARTTLEKSMPRPASGGAQRANRMDFSGQKEIPDSVRSRKEKI